MGYRLSYAQADELFRKLSAEYEIYAPKLFPKQGRYSDTDLVRYDVVEKAEDIVYDRKSDFSAKEVVSPITQTIFYFTEDEYRESRTGKKKILIFLRPCDINAFEHQDRIFLDNGGVTDVFYKRVRDRVRFVMMECVEGWDTCFCVSMNANKTEDYSAAVRFDGQSLLFQVKDPDLAPYFDGQSPEPFEPDFISQNKLEVKIPEIPNKDVLNKLKKHPMWDEFNDRCISCGSCTVACSTCTCFTTVDKVYSENENAGERRRVTASCQVEGFDCMAGGNEFRKTAADRMRYRVLHKVHDYKARFKDFHMCVGCGRCSARCPKFISFPATINKMAAAIEEIRSGETVGAK